MIATDEIKELQQQIDSIVDRLKLFDENIQPQFSIFNNFYKKLVNSLKIANNKLNEYFFSIYKDEDESISDAGIRFHNKVPEAVGIMRLCQLEGIFLLKKFDELLLRLNIPYIIDYGNLLGYVRSGRAVPWDDDIDIDMLIEDLIKVIENMKLFDDYNDYEIRCDKEGRPKFAACGYPSFVDIIVGVKVNNMEEYEVNKELFSRLSVSRNKDSLLSIYNNGSNDPLSFIKAIYKEMKDNFKQVNNTESNPKNESIYVRVALIYMYSPFPTPINSIYPISRGIYEGIEINIPNDPNYLLLNRYGDYWYLPNDITHRHRSSKNIKKVMDFANFIKNKDINFYNERILPVVNDMEVRE